jgi:hypothetical protein
MLHLAELCGRIEDGWALPVGGPGEATLSAATALVAAIQKETEAEIKRQRGELVHDLADLYRRRSSYKTPASWEKAVGEVFWYAGYRDITAQEIKLAANPIRRVRAMGPKQCAAEVLEGILHVSARSLFSWAKIPQMPTRADENALAYRKLLAFLRALRAETRPMYEGDLRGIEAQVVKRLRSKDAAARKR